MGRNLFQGWHLLILLVIVLVLFGATRLPALSRSIAQSFKIFKKEIRDEPGVVDPGTTSTSRDGATNTTPTDPGSGGSDPSAGSSNSGSTTR